GEVKPVIDAGGVVNLARQSGMLAAKAYLPSRPVFPETYVPQVPAPRPRRARSGAGADDVLHPAHPAGDGRRVAGRVGAGSRLPAKRRRGSRCAEARGGGVGELSVRFSRLASHWLALGVRWGPARQCRLGAGQGRIV